MQQKVYLVWFKRDLRLTDHLPLKLALASAHRAGAFVLALYIVEPLLWKEPDRSYRHYLFLRTALLALEGELAQYGQRLWIKVGEVTQVLEELAATFTIAGVFSHQETGNRWTYGRDLRVASWLRARSIPWSESPQHGVVRRLPSRDRWADLWHAYMLQEPLAIPTREEWRSGGFSNLEDLRSKQPQSGRDRFQGEELPLPEQLGLAVDGIKTRLEGGSTEAQKLLKSFLYERGEHYQREMSSPLTAFTSCSRLSVHLSFGTISMREVFQAALRRQRELRLELGEETQAWLGSLRAFLSRLRWQGHFMQKLEDQPSIEFLPMHPLYQKLQEPDLHHEASFEAWSLGQTGFPMIDASMRALIATGWINFRMRAMLMSFASHHLALPWKKPAHHLARLFLDYEPGIHYAQIQMQSGSTGINTIRIYNPIKQGLDQDPNGHFLRQYIPELAKIPFSGLHTPWLFPHKMQSYPLPIVEELRARRDALYRMSAIRKSPHHAKEAKRVVEQHASRALARQKKITKKRIAPKQPASQRRAVGYNDQMELPFGP